MLGMRSHFLSVISSVVCGYLGHHSNAFQTSAHRTCDTYWKYTRDSPPNPHTTSSPIKEFWDASWAATLGVLDMDAPSFCFRVSVVPEWPSGDLEVSVMYPLEGPCFPHPISYYGSFWEQRWHHLSLLPLPFIWHSTLLRAVQGH